MTARTRTPRLRAPSLLPFIGPKRDGKPGNWGARDDGNDGRTLSPQSKGVGNQLVWSLGTLGTIVSALHGARMRADRCAVLERQKTKSSRAIQTSFLSSLASLSSQYLNFMNEIKDLDFTVLGRKLSIWVDSSKFGTEGVQA